MQSITPETVYELTPNGHDVMQHRSLQLPTELRFLMMLINGSRTVGTLRVVSPGAKQDDAGFIILMEYGLIKSTGDEQSANSHPDLSHEREYQTPLTQGSNEKLMQQKTSALQDSMPISVLTEAQAVEINSSYYSHDVVSTAQTYERSFATDAAVTFDTEMSLPAAGHDNQNRSANEATICNSSDELAAIEASHDDYDNDTQKSPHTLSQSSGHADHDSGDLHNAVSNEDRCAVEDILQRALKQDAKFVIDQLSQKNTYADFLPAVKKIENVLRQTVSVTDANALRKRFLDVF